MLSIVRLSRERLADIIRAATPAASGLANDVPADAAAPRACSDEAAVEGNAVVTNAALIARCSSLDGTAAAIGKKRELVMGSQVVKGFLRKNSHFIPQKIFNLEIDICPSIFKNLRPLQTYQTFLNRCSQYSF